MATKPILVVDDEPIVRESIRDWLKDAGYEVATAESGEEALSLVAKQDFSVIIMDIRLPGKTGIAVLKEIKEVKPGIKSVIITAYPTTEFATEAKKLGVVDFLIKPVAPDDLERLVRETLAKLAQEK
jgi:DNA-binding NtrC family response regulator